MQNFYATWQVLCNVALSCALNGIGVAMFTLLILAWNNCAHANEQIREHQYQCSR
jgi:hypothetical protein